MFADVKKYILHMFLLNQIKLILNRKFASFLLFQMVVVTGFSQTRISGIVKDAKGRAIPGASITVKNSFDGATSDSTGKYSFSCSDTGIQTLTVTSVGFRPIEVTFTKIRGS